MAGDQMRWQRAVDDIAAGGKWLWDPLLCLRAWGGLEISVGFQYLCFPDLRTSSVLTVFPADLLVSS